MWVSTFDLGAYFNMRKTMRIRKRLWMQMRMCVRQNNTVAGNVNVHVHVHGHVTVTWNVRRSNW